MVDTYVAVAGLPVLIIVLIIVAYLAHRKTKSWAKAGFAISAIIGIAALIVALGMASTLSGQLALALYLLSLGIIIAGLSGLVSK